MSGFARMTARSLAWALALLVGPQGVASAQDADQFPPAQLEAMVTPYLDLPTPVLAAVFNASKYSAAVADAAGALETPPTATVDPTQLPPSLQNLMQSEPDLLMAMAEDIEATALLGTAYQSQAGDVWIAVGAARTRAAMLAAAEPAPDPSAAPASPAPQPVTGAPPAAAAPAVPPSAADQQPPPSTYPAASSAAPTYAAPTYVAPAYAPVPTNTVVVQEAGYSGGEVAAAGIVGFGLGAVTGAAIADDDDGDYDVSVDVDQAYDYRSDLQEDRQDYGEESYEQRSQDRQAAYDQRQSDQSAAYEQRSADQTKSQASRQSAAQESRASRQASAQQAQSSRQATAQEAQASRQAGAQQAQATWQQGQGTRQANAQQAQGSRQQVQASQGGWGPFASAGGSRFSGRRR